MRRPSEGRALVWHYPNLWGESQDRAEGYGAYSALLKGDYRLIYFWETGERRLYHIRKDIGERMIWRPVSRSVCSAWRLN